MISNCGHDENGRYSGGAAGDQNATEWQIRSWYSRPWTHVIRHPNRNVGDTIAEMAIQGANNDNIGYDQNERLSFWNELKNVGYWPKNIKRKCETDCSASTAACVKAAGYILDIDALKYVSADCYSGNIRAALKTAGFDILTDSMYLNNEDYLFNGDILLYEGHHVAICVSDGSKVNRKGSDPMGVVMGSINNMDFRRACLNVCDTARTEMWMYGDSHGLPRKTHVVSCDRMLFQALYDLGYTDQKFGLETVVTMEDWLVQHGFSKICKPSYMTHGDICLFRKDGNKKATWEDHTFVVDQYYSKTKIWKYDCGSRSRILSPQPFQNVQLDEWPNKSFYAAFRLPRKDASITEGDYYITSAFGDEWVMDVKDGSVEKRANIQLYKRNDTPAQIFHVKPLGKNLYRIINKKSGLVFDIADGSTEENGNLQQYRNNLTAAQKFYIQDCGDGFCTIQNYKSGLVLDIAGGAKAKRTNIRQWSLNNTPAQKWKFIKA